MTKNKIYSTENDELVKTDKKLRNISMNVFLMRYKILILQDIK